MRLLRVYTLRLEEFNDADIPPYAILSQTWAAGREVTFAEIQRIFPSTEDPLDQPRSATVLGEIDASDLLALKITSKSGFNKIRQFCQAAANDGFNYAWVDTCCIEKRSSSELSEAINSMYGWYQQAEVCYVYLSEVGGGSSHEGPIVARTHAMRNAFMASKWFTRGWTLQELIAPASVTFFDQDWQELGTKLSLKDIITETTGIQTEVLLGSDLDNFIVAQRMSWASRRTTTRVEDQSYCLMGIFGVNMPMLYGEGSRSFRRLQEEIIRNSNGHSILAWSGEEWQEEEWLLAPSPAAFKDCGNVATSIYYGMTRNSIGLTNKGVHVRVDPVEAVVNRK